MLKNKYKEIDVKSLVTIALSAAVLVFGLMASAQPGPGRQRPSMPEFSDFDGNQDGAISPEELGEGRAKRMQQRAKEGRRLRGIKNAPKFKDMDTNKDGKLDQQEFDSHQLKRLKEKRGRGRG